jgi:hypothetical protein
MQKLTKRLPSPAMVVACIALTVALGGTAYASVSRNSVGTVHLKRNAVTSIKVRNNSLTGADIRESRLGRVPSATRALTANSAATATTANSATTATSATTAGSAPVSRLDYSVTNTFPIPAFGSAHLVATCPAGLNATGGGAKLVDPVNGLVADSNPVGKTGWEATGFSDTAQNMTVYVICAQAATTTP